MEKKQMQFREELYLWDIGWWSVDDGTTREAARGRNQEASREATTKGEREDDELGFLKSKT